MFKVVCTIAFVRCLFNVVCTGGLCVLGKDKEWGQVCFQGCDYNSFCKNLYCMV